MILIKNAKLPREDKKVHTLDLLFDEKSKKIVEISPKIENADAKTVDAKGDYILPAFTDLYAKTAAPENNESTALCALWGGYSDILLASGNIENNNNCRFHTPESVNAVILESDHTLNAKELRELMKKCASEDKLLLASPKKDPLYPDSCLTEGRTASLLKLPSEPPSVEARSVYEYLILAEETGCRLHIRGISTEPSVDLIRNAKKQQVLHPIPPQAKNKTYCLNARGEEISHGSNKRSFWLTCSTSPCYFSLTDEDTVFIGTNSKVYPPLRSTRDKRAVIEGIADNTIDCIDSAHTPVAAEKKGFDTKNAEYGAIGLQTVFSAACTYLLMPGYIDIFRLYELLSFNPAKILGIEGAKYVDENCKAFVLASVLDEYILTKSNLISEAKNCPYIGMSLCGVIKKIFI